MTVWMTKVWGWAEPVGPLQFSTEGWRRRAREQIQPGDVVAMVGTHGAETDPEKRGMILGLMEPTTEPVTALDFDLQPLASHFVDGHYKWPFGLLNRTAWTFEEPYTRLSDITSRRFGMGSAQGLVALSDDEGARVLALPRRPAKLLSSFRTDARIHGEDEARRRGAPPPTTTRRGSMHMRRAAAYTYVMAIDGANQPAFKIGWAFDYRARERTFNHAAAPRLGGLRYRTILRQHWPTARQAFAMEQGLLARFSANTLATNREIVLIAKDDIEKAWTDHIVAARISTKTNL